MVVHICNSSTWEAEVEEDHKFKTSLGYTLRPYLKNTKQMKNTLEAGCGGASGNTHIIPVFRRWRQEDFKFEASLGEYQNPASKKKKKKQKERKKENTPENSMCWENVEKMEPLCIVGATVK
jgi:hypothetical protein